MKRIALSLLAFTAIAAGTAARADHVNVSGSISIGAPVYRAPVYAVPSPVYVTPRGYWTESRVNVWVPARWVVHHDRFGRQISQWEPGHYELRTQRVWVSADNRHHDRHDQGRYDHGDHNRGWDRR